MDKERVTVKKEEIRFRYLYGFAILFVVLSHCDGGGMELLSNWMHFGAFHLAVFVFGSGYFFRADQLRAPLTWLWHKVKCLLLPVWGWNLAYGMLIRLMHPMGFTFGEQLSIRNLLIFPIKSENLYVLNMGSWFVFSLFMVQLLYGICKLILDRFCKAEWAELILQIGFLLAGFTGVYLARHGFHETWMYPVFRVLYFMPFYSFGVLYRTYLDKLMKKISVETWLILCLMAALLLNTYFGRVVYTIPSSCDYPFGVIATYLSAVIGIVFWLKCSEWLAEANGLCKPLLMLGRNTWNIMIHQFLGIMVVKTFFAIGYRFLHIFQDFDPQSYFSDIWYLYQPAGLHEYTFLYVIGAIVISVLIGMGSKYLEKICKKVFSYL